MRKNCIFDMHGHLNRTSESCLENCLNLRNQWRSKNVQKNVFCKVMDVFVWNIFLLSQKPMKFKKLFRKPFSKIEIEFQPFSHVIKDTLKYLFANFQPCFIIFLNDFLLGYLWTCEVIESQLLYMFNFALYFLFLFYILLWRSLIYLIVKKDKLYFIHNLHPWRSKLSSLQTKMNAINKRLQLSRQDK